MQPMLKNLQANILKGHGRDFAYHIFLRLDPAKIAAAKTWIRAFGAAKVTSSMKQLQSRADHKTDGTDGGPVFTLSISATGYSALGIATLPVEVSVSHVGTRPNLNNIATPAFTDGMRNVNTTNKLLADDMSGWEANFKEQLDIMILVADDTVDKALFLATQIEGQVKPFCQTVFMQKGHILHRSAFNGQNPDDTINIEHFGYADGVSQPMYISDEVATQAANTKWKDQENLNLVLVGDANGGAVDSFGSFLVFRKLEQDIHSFIKTEKQLAPIEDTDGFPNHNLPGAMLVGRFRDGNVVVNSNGYTGEIVQQSQITNDFDYSGDTTPVAPGSTTDSPKCPFFAHTRITNPRHDVGPDPGSFAHLVRLTRRAIPYDDVNRFGEANENLLDPTQEQLDGHTPAKGAGLLFMCYQAHIGDQFEFIQSQWVNKGNIGGHLIAQDGIIGQGPLTNAPPQPLDKKLPDQWGQPIAANSPTINFGHFVHNKGGEYFFTPSISALAAIV
jgi:Dyp-type peroxidase family